MIRFRRFYYDIFSYFYDLIIRLHSKDESSALRDFLIKKTSMGPGDKVLDICTGTGSVCIAAHQAVAPKGLVIGLDFSVFMMEHCKPQNPVIKLLYYIRLMSMGSPENRNFAADEVPVIKKFLKDIKRELSPTGKSKIISGMK